MADELDAKESTPQLGLEDGPSPSEVSTKTETTEKTPTDAKSAPETKEPEANEPFHKNPRFQELVSEKNEWKERATRMEQLLAEKSGQPKADPDAEALKELTELNIDEKAARKILNAVKKSVTPMMNERVAPLEAKTVKAETDGWIESFKKEHTDFEALEPEMTKVFESLPERTKMLVVSDPKGLELLYDHVSKQNFDAKVKESYEKGKADAYKTKQEKSSLSPTPAGSKAVSSELSRSSINAMTPAEYKARRKEILSAASRGEIKED